MMLSAEGERPLEGLIPAIKCFSLTCFCSRVIGQNGHMASPNHRGTREAIIPCFQESGTLGEALTTMATCQWFGQSWQVFRIDSLVFGPAPFSSSGRHVCVRLCVHFLGDLTDGTGSQLISLPFPARFHLIPTQACEAETTCSPCFNDELVLRKIKSFNQKRLN